MRYDQKDLKDENPKYCYKDKFSDVDWHDIFTLTTALRSKIFEIVIVTMIKFSFIYLKNVIHLFKNQSIKYNLLFVFEIGMEANIPVF